MIVQVCDLLSLVRTYSKLPNKRTGWNNLQNLINQQIYLNKRKGWNKYADRVEGTM